RLATEDGIDLLRLPANQGKGGAVMAGLRHAQRLGWTHALQIDADGQHDAGDVPAFVAQAEAHPDHFICGCPVYDASVPKGRLYGRYAT
ncbi:glycosyltransferase, partial [Pseudomonas zeae]|uniref:glycosyltransferase n=1 Tax=Pseudomonas zeae TaxID=2745510 RepID=UPI003D0289D6